jgi:AraC-like DNA-binding protein
MRDKIFGTAVGTPLNRDAKRRVLAYARSWNARHRQQGQHIGPLTRTTFDVLRALLFSFHNQHTGRCFPSYEAIAQAASCARSTVALAIKALERAGVLRWIHRLRRSGARVLRTSNAYVFTVPQSSSENPTRTQNQGILPSSSPSVPAAPQIIVLDPRSALDAALIRLGQHCGALP